MSFKRKPHRATTFTHKRKLHAVRMKLHLRVDGSGSPRCESVSNYFLAADASSRAAVPGKIRDALSTMGFKMYLTSTGSMVIDDVYEVVNSMERLINDNQTPTEELALIDSLQGIPDAPLKRRAAV